jgi:hypothetical protein
MATSLIDLQNSFVRFNEQEFITDNDCGVVVDTCLPICTITDLRFQFLVVSDDYPTEADLVTALQIRRITSSGATTITSVGKDSLSLGSNAYVIFLEFSTSTLLSSLSDGDCFQIQLNFLRDEPPAYLSTTSITCFKYSVDKCFTSRITYTNNEDAFGFYYNIPSTPNWINAIRLPMYAVNPAFDIEQKTYVRSNGVRTKVFARLAKKYKFVTDFLPEEIHQKLVVALNHDTVNLQVSSNEYALQCTFENEYNQDFPSIMQGMNVWPADFQVYETPFNEINNNCG